MYLLKPTITTFANPLKILKQIAVKTSSVTRNGKTFTRLAHTQNRKVTQLVSDLTEKTLSTATIPTNKEILLVGKEIAKDFIRNPVKAIKEGRERELLVKGLIQSTTGKTLPANSALIKDQFAKGVNAIKQNEELQKDLIVNTGGVIGSTLGSVAGLPGQLAGDLLGAATVRKAVTDITVTKSAITKARTDVVFNSLSSFDKFKKVREISLKELKDLAEQGKLTDDIVADTSGWAVGNALAESTKSILPVPFRGAVGASVSVPDFIKASRRIRAGENTKQVVKETATEVLLKPVKMYQRGKKREQLLRTKLNSKLQQILGKQND